MSHLTVLLVDDDEVDRLGLKRGLTRANLTAEVTEAGSAEAALTLFSPSTRPAFDLAFIDLHLPGEDGLELLRALKRSDPSLPVIVMTGQGNEERAVELMKAGASDYLIKGTVSPARLAQSVGQALALARETRRRHAAEDALVRLAAHLPDTVVRFDGRHRHVHMNRVPPWAEADDPRAVLGRTLSELRSNLDLAPLEGALKDALAGLARTLTLEVAVDADNEDEAPNSLVFEVRLVPEPADAEGPTALALVRDITAERERKLEETRRLDFERQLMGIVSHDLKSPIAALSMVSEILGRELADPSPRVSRALGLLETSTSRARRLITDILDFTRARLGGGIPMQRRLVDLGAVAEQIANEVRIGHPGREVELTRKGDLSGRFDPDRLAQVMTNLLTNALDHGDPTSPVTFEVLGRDREVTMTVQNRGETLSPDTLSTLFEPFQQGPRISGETPPTASVGLGLFIVRHIVESHRGTIVVRSDEGLTTFSVSLPRKTVTSTWRAITASELGPDPKSGA